MLRCGQVRLLSMSISAQRKRERCLVAFRTAQRAHVAFEVTNRIEELRIRELVFKSTVSEGRDWADCRF